LTRVVAALGGNALLERGQPLDAATQRRNVATAVSALAELAGAHELIITHGNGPQVGLLALQAAAYREVEPYPLDVLGAESEGMIGYLVQQGLENALPDRNVVTVLTEVVVDADDPAFAHPTKPIGPVYTIAAAAELSAANGWAMGADGDAVRRIVPSPVPRAIVELSSIRMLVESGALVICAGGGGIPVIENGGYHGVEAVIDKDFAAALLAEDTEADALLLLTDVPAVYRDWGAPTQEAIDVATSAELRALDCESGSMGPKVEAACRFVDRTGGFAGIGALAAAAQILHGTSGTRIVA
jgi:carbamate kinase